MVSPVFGSILIQSGNSSPLGRTPSYFIMSLFVSLNTLKDKTKLSFVDPNNSFVLVSATKSTNFNPSERPDLFSTFNASIEFLPAPNIDFALRLLSLTDIASALLTSLLINLSAFLSLKSLTEFPFCNLIIIVP